MTIEVKTTIEFSAQDIAEIVTNAIEGGAMGVYYWCRAIHPVNEKAATEIVTTAGEGPWYALAKYWEAGCEAEVFTDNEDDQALVKTRLNMATIGNALNRMAKGNPALIKRLAEGDGDASDCEMVIQNAVMGEVVFEPDELEKKRNDPENPRGLLCRQGPGPGNVRPGRADCKHSPRGSALGRRLHFPT